jgi:NTE family protein
MRIRRALLASVAAVTCAACAAPFQRTARAPSPDANRGLERVRQELGRSRVGVAFGGGSARGIAHVGVIQWFEEHRIPIDVGAGTSMGGLVGGAFATGMDAAELRAFVTALNWDQLFGASTFQYKNIRRKADARDYPARLEFGLRGGIVPPIALNSGEYVDLLLSRITAPYFELEDFDDLPTPFRTVAVDLLSAQPVVMGRGSFADAMRATMSLPLIFPPVEVDGRLLVDGGTMNNVPADVVKSMGADRVVAVNVGDLSDREGVSFTMLGVAGTTLDAMMRASAMRALKSADVIINVPLAKYGSLDWRRAGDLIAEGYRAADAMRDQLLPLAVGDAEYEEWRRARQSRRRIELPTPTFIELEGFGGSDAKRLNALLARHVGTPLNIQAIERDVEIVAGLDRYETVVWRVVHDTTRGFGLHVRGRVKRYAPPFMMLGLNLENTTSSDFRITATGRYLTFDLVGSGSELRVDGTLGSDPSIGAELYRPIGPTPFFVAPYGAIGRRTLDFIVDNQVIARYRESGSRVGVNLGINLGARSDLRIGSYVGEANASILIGDPGFPELHGKETGAEIVWRIDTQDRPIVPSHGLLSRVQLTRAFNGPDLTVSGEPFDVDATFTQLSATGTQFWSVGPPNRVFITGGIGTSFNKVPLPPNQFSLGLPFRLGAYAPGEVRGAHFYAVTLGYMRQVGRLPDFLGGPVFAGAWLENADAFDAWKLAGWRSNGGAGLVMDTLIGPVIVTGSWSFDGRWRTYIGIGRVFR